jgi:hypothetical protein
MFGSTVSILLVEYGRNFTFYKFINGTLKLVDFLLLLFWLLLFWTIYYFDQVNCHILFLPSVLRKNHSASNCYMIISTALFTTFFALNVDPSIFPTFSITGFSHREMRSKESKVDSSWVSIWAKLSSCTNKENDVSRPRPCARTSNIRLYIRLENKVIADCHPTEKTFPHFFPFFVMYSTIPNILKKFVRRNSIKG